MNDPTESNSSEKLLAGLITQITNQLQAGESVDIESYVRAAPEHGQRLRRLIPAVQALVDLGSSADQPTSAALSDDPGLVPENLGDFLINREIGRGGMGIVYEAKQRSLGRLVALKVLPFASVLNERRLQRFNIEAQTAALLEHPNIVPVYSVGTERGVHFYAMKLIHGQNLAEILSESRNNAGAGHSRCGEIVTDESSNEIADVPANYSNSPLTDTKPIAELSTQRSNEPQKFFGWVADVGIQAAEALEYAHQSGVVHRDIKPSNVLIDQAGKLWLTDFGLAQIQGSSQLTLTGDVLGTLRYMSPEQALGKKLLDHRTDVYSLGITLYELLAGRPPFENDDRQQLLKHVAETEPQHPCESVRSIPRDLETIVMKAIAKSPVDRYDTAQHLADDLRRFTSHQPILAKRPSTVKKLTKWCHRHRVVLRCVTACLLASFLVGFALVNHQRVRANRAAARSEENLLNLMDVLDQVLLPTAEDMSSRAGMWSTQHKLATEILEVYESISEQDNEDPTTEFAKAKAYRRVGGIYLRLQRNNESEAASQEAIQLLTRLSKQFPTKPAYRHELAQTHRDLNILYRLTGRNQAALQEIQKAQRVFQSYLSLSPNNAEALRGLACVHCETAGTLFGQPDRAIRNLQMALKYQERANREIPESEEDLANVVRIHQYLGRDYQMTNDFDLAFEHRSKALHACDKLLQVTTNRRDHAFLQTLQREHLARLYNRMRRPRDADPLLRAAIDTSESLLAEFPENEYLRRHIQQLHAALCDSLLSLGETADAERFALDEIRDWNELVSSGIENPEYQIRRASAHYRYGLIMWFSGRKKEARQSFERTCEMTSIAQRWPKHRHFAKTAARFLVTCPEPSFRNPTMAIEMLKQIDRPNYHDYDQFLGVAHCRAGNWERAIRMLDRAVSFCNGGDEIDWLFLAMAHWHLGDQRESKRCYQQASERTERPIYGFVFGHPQQFVVLRREVSQLIGVDPNASESPVN